MTDVQEIYSDRNRLVLLAATMAREAGYEVGLIVDPAEPEWPVIAIVLPSGQVSWHVPRALVGNNAAEWPPLSWDGHDNAEKARRIDAWCGPAS